MIFRPVARSLARSPLFGRARSLWERNQQDVLMPLSRLDKLLVGAHLILRDFGEGRFPPRFDNQQRAYQAEIAYREALPGLDGERLSRAMMTKPFWSHAALKSYLAAFVDVVGALEQAGVKPPQRILELGCGTGWMSEFLAVMGFSVLGTSISPQDIQDAQLRVESLRARRVGGALEFRVAPMESVDEVMGQGAAFDAVLVFEALHHAYDWRQALCSSHACLKPGGWLLIANEPNALHTFIAYRIARITDTHEIGFTQRELLAQLRRAGFKRIRPLKSAFSFWLRPHWILAQK